jgi:hypothetical protein
MRKFLIPLLLASAAASPAIAAPRNWSDNQQTQSDQQQSRDDRQQAREDRQQSRDTAREERVQARDTAREERAADNASFTQSQSQSQSQSQAQSQVQTQQRGDRQQFDRAQQRAADARQQVIDRQTQVEPKTVRPPSFDRDSNAAQRDARMQQVHQRIDQHVQDVRHPPVVSNTPSPGTQPPLRREVRRTPTVQWNTSWRNNHRYDWHNYRHHHHSLFHLGFYFDPYGWGYSPFQIGWRLWPNYYSSNYWINDPWMYRLPYAPPGYVWVRYWNDALLVDTWSGTVVDMIPGFFW